MDTTTLTIIFQAVVQIGTILWGVWKLLNNQNAMNEKISALQSELRLQRGNRNDPTDRRM